MKPLIGTFLALALIFGAALYAMPSKAQEVTAPIVRVVIKDDPGGNLGTYYKALTILKAQNVGVKLDGMCASACTLIASTDFNMDVCVTPAAVLGIHHPFMMGPDGDIGYTVPAISGAGQVWSEVFYKKYPSWLQKLIDNDNGAPDVYKGNAPSDLLRVDYNELSKHYKVCG
jgi:hypothetical protein